MFKTYIWLAPKLTVAWLVVPVAAGMLGVLLPAFGWLPPFDRASLDLTAWPTLAKTPGIWRMIAVSFCSGLATAAISFAIVSLFLAGFSGSRAQRTILGALSPILSVPHAAAAIGLAFLIAPSGLLFRSVSPWLTGWDRPPDILIIGDPFGISMIVGLLLKEVPFLLLMSLAGLPQCQAPARLAIARTLGYRPVAAWYKAVLPSLYPLIRLPIFAVIAFSSSTVDLGLILGPSTPPPLSVAVLRWMNDPDLHMRRIASAGALLQFGVTLSALATWWLGERLVTRLTKRWLESGHRSVADALLASVGTGAALISVLMALGSLLALGLWSVSGLWPFPDVLPSTVSLRSWSAALPSLRQPVLSTALIAAVSSLASLVLVVGCLEAELHRGRRASRTAQVILYLPLIVPSIAFLFGVVLVQEIVGLGPGLLPVTVVHSLFVLPYVYLALAQAYRQLDPRWSHLARTLGAAPMRAFLCVRLPLLAVPLLTAAAIGFAVSVGQYLPTVLIGAGRVSTITTEAVALASGGNRRITAVYAILQMALPALAFVLALKAPRLIFRNARIMREIR